MSSFFNTLRRKIEKNVLLFIIVAAIVIVLFDVWQTQSLVKQQGPAPVVTPA